MCGRWDWSATAGEGATVHSCPGAVCQGWERGIPQCCWTPGMVPENSSAAGATPGPAATEGALIISPTHSGCTLTKPTTRAEPRCEQADIGAVLQLPPRRAFPVLIPFFFSFFLSFHPTWLCGDLSCSFGCIWDLLCFQLVFCGNCFTRRCIFDMFMKEGELRMLLLCHLDLPPNQNSFSF